jgi:hypothetical protein
VAQGNDPFAVMRQADGPITFDSSRDAIEALS